MNFQGYILSAEQMNSLSTVSAVQSVKEAACEQEPEFTIDIVIPVYNGEVFIKEAVLSAVNQTYLPQQIIVVDDGSTDHTGLVVQELAQNALVSIKYIRQENRGLSAARNAGIRACTGKYIAFLDADDLWQQDKLKKQVEVFRQSEYKNLGVVYCDYSNIDATGAAIDFPCLRLDTTVRGYVFDRLLIGNLIASSGSGVLVKKACFDTVGVFDESLPNGEDWEMWMRIAKVYDFDFVNQKLVKIRRHNSNMSNDTVGMMIGKLLVLNKVNRDLPYQVLQLVRYELTKCTVDAYNNGGLIDFSKYMTNLLKDQIYCYPHG